MNDISRICFKVLRQRKKTGMKKCDEFHRVGYMDIHYTLCDMFENLHNKNIFKNSYPKKRTLLRGIYLVLFSCEANYIYLCKAPWKHSTQHQRVPKAVITGSTRTVTATDTPSTKEWVTPLQVPLILLSKAPEAWVLPGIHSPTRSKRRESHAQLSPKFSHFWRTLAYCHLRKQKKQQLDKTRFSPAASTSPHMLKHVEELHPQGLQTSSATGCDPGPWTVLVTRMLHQLVNKFNCLHNLLFNDTEQP